MTYPLSFGVAAWPTRLTTTALLKPTVGILVLTLCQALPSSAWAQAGGAASPAPAGAPPTPGQTAGHQTAEKDDLQPFQINGQLNYIVQTVSRFPTRYTNVGHATNSFLSRRETEASETYTIFLGARLRPRFEAYFDPELAAGHGLSQAVGIAGFTDGDVIRNPTLSQEPYLARYFVRYTIPTGRGQTRVGGAQHQVSGILPDRRLVLSAGKFGVNDFFDVSSYANSTHTNYLNWAFLNNGAYDYAADTRGYTRGVVAEFVQPTYAVRLGSFQMPVVANGIDLASRLDTNRGDNLEVELHHPLFRTTAAPLILRVLGYRNTARMGNYRESLALAQSAGTTPDITATRRPKAIKYGYGLNVEQSLADDGNTGLFGRYSWDDGRTETFVYTEIDSSLSGGYQLSGAKWRRPKDHVSVGLVRNGLSAPHRDYLAAGGVGFIVGDGALRYGPEQILETQYAYQISGPVALTLDFQHIQNPGYNRDRGPINVPSLRLHAEF